MTQWRMQMSHQQLSALLLASRLGWVASSCSSAYLAHGQTACEKRDGHAAHTLSFVIITGENVQFRSPLVAELHEARRQRA